MKILFKKLLQFYLKYITKLVLLIHKPTIIAIAGSANKTFVKEEINRVICKAGERPLCNPKSFNTEIGLPLAILDLPSGYNSYKDWLPVIFKSLKQIFQINFPKYLVLELGVSDPGDMKYLLSIVNPKIAVITDLTQRYLEGFEDMDNLADEYEYLIKKLNKKKNSLILANYDNERIKKIANISKNNVIYFGFNDGADWQAIELKKGVDNQAIKINCNNIVKEYKINRFGRHHVYALLAGLIIKYNVEAKKI